jgi:hypothetical protein
MAQGVLEKLVTDDIKKSFNAAAKYRSGRHTVQKRLWARFKNSQLFDKGQDYTNVQTGRFYYIADYLFSILKDTLLDQRPLGKITGEGQEDFPGSKAIDKVNCHQQTQGDMETARDDVLLKSVVTGTGVELWGWKYETRKYIDRIEKTIPMPDIANPLGPSVPMPTGEYEYKELATENDNIHLQSIPPWRLFLSAGASSVDAAEKVMVLVRSSKSQLAAMALDGYLRDIELIDDNVFGRDMDDDPYISEAEVKKAEGTNKENTEDKDTIWLIYCFGQFPLSIGESPGVVDLKNTDKELAFCIRPLYDDTILKLERCQLPAPPINVWKYSGSPDEADGTSVMEIAEQLFALDEDMFGYVQDRAQREVYKTLVLPKKADDSEWRPYKPDAIAHMSDEFFGENKKPFYLDQGATPMPHMIEQRKITSQLTDDITGIQEFVYGGDTQEGETATKTTERSKFLKTRFKARARYYEEGPIRLSMHWQTVLNHLYLDDSVVEGITGIPAFANPFKLIEPTIPIKSHDFTFEGSLRAIDDPVKAQILRGIIEMIPNIPPGFDENGQMVQPNSMFFFRQMVRCLDVVEDIDKGFIPTAPVPLGPMGQPGAGGSELGPVNPRQVMSGVMGNMPSKSAGIPAGN